MHWLRILLLAPLALFASCTSESLGSEAGGNGLRIQQGDSTCTIFRYSALVSRTPSDNGAVYAMRGALERGSRVSSAAPGEAIGFQVVTLGGAEKTVALNDIAIDVSSTNLSVKEGKLLGTTVARLVAPVSSGCERVGNSVTSLYTRASILTANFSSLTAYTCEQSIGTPSGIKDRLEQVQGRLTPSFDYGYSEQFSGTLIEGEPGFGASGWTAIQNRNRRTWEAARWSVKPIPLPLSADVSLRYLDVSQIFADRGEVIDATGQLQLRFDPGTQRVTWQIEVCGESSLTRPIFALSNLAWDLQTNLPFLFAN